jgi:hypothetical protein
LNRAWEEPLTRLETEGAYNEVKNERRACYALLERVMYFTA